ncbi:MAG TPA: squalene synthase HpnC [Magnetovibrio sp.]
MSGRNAGNENFPVASFLLPAEIRPHVIAFYTFARTADDIADAPRLSADEKLAQLTQLGEQLDGGKGEPGASLRCSLQQTRVTPDHARHLLQAFMRDAVRPTTQDWADLLAYCELSAAPVGRFLIDLSGGIEGDDYAPSDALCAALQILNHLQDVKDDAESLGRIYVPADWMAAMGVEARDLVRPACTPHLRAVLDRMLDGVDALLVQASPLPKTVRAKFLSREAGGILAIARRLSKALRANDPLAKRVALAKPVAALCFLWGALTA